MANSPSAAFLRLRAFIAKRMRMSPIDQPLMLMELLGRSSPAPAQDVARRILDSVWWDACSPATASPASAKGLHPDRRRGAERQRARRAAVPGARARTDQSLKGYKVGLKRDPKAIRLKADAIIRNTYRTLMSRGTKACWVFACDPDLNQWLKQGAGMGS